MAAPASWSGSKRPNSGDSNERRVQPRHFHDIPSLTIASSDVGDMKAVCLPPTTTTMHLYRHALESIFGFLSLDEVVVVLQVSRRWLAAVNSMVNMKLVVAPPKAPLFVVATSALGHHTATLGTDDNRLKLIPDTLFILARHMTHLKGLVCDLSFPSEQVTMKLPFALEVLDIAFSAHVTVDAINTALMFIGHLPKLTSLTIRVPTFDPLISFSSLVSLLELQVLSVHWSSVLGEDLSDVQIDELRALTQLKHILFLNMTAKSLRRILRQPHALQWQTFVTNSVLNDKAVTFLPQLPSLTKIDLQTVCSRFDWLSRLPNLTSVDLEFRGRTVAGQVESLMVELRGCTLITNLALRDNTDITADRLAELLPQLPQLQWLCLAGLDLSTLSFLAQEPMTRQLQTLVLDDCDQLPLTELRHVHSLRGLKKLELLDSFITSMDAHCQSFYTPPSVILPQLVMFKYVP